MLLRTKVINDLFVVLLRNRSKVPKKELWKNVSWCISNARDSKNIWRGPWTRRKKNTRPINSTIYGPHASSITQEYLFSCACDRRQVDFPQRPLFCFAFFYLRFFKTLFKYCDFDWASTFFFLTRAEVKDTTWSPFWTLWSDVFFFSDRNKCYHCKMVMLTERHPYIL